MPPTESIAIDVTPGRLYAYEPFGVAVGPPWVYAVIGTARDGRTRQERVVYEGVTGPDAGEWLCCSLSDFAAKFAPHQPDPPDPPAGFP